MKAKRYREKKQCESSCTWFDGVEPLVVRAVLLHIPQVMMDVQHGHFRHGWRLELNLERENAREIKGKANGGQIKHNVPFSLSLSSFTLSLFSHTVEVVQCV